MDDLQIYKLQLQQVEGALKSDPENEDLLKLKIDFEELIELTQYMVKSRQPEKEAVELKKVPVELVAPVARMDPKQREYRKKRRQKKQEHLKELEGKREQEKNKWLAFAGKFHVTKKGVMKRSIFATPESAYGRVGIGTCGISGKEMTKYTNRERCRRLT